MATIIAGTFQRLERARLAIAQLERAGFSTAQMASFFVNAPGQHGCYPIGGDVDESAGAHHASGGAAAGAAVGSAVGAAVGAVAIPVAGPAAVVAGAGIGAYAGSLYGALGKMGDEARSTASNDMPVDSDGDEAPPRPSGILVAVSLPAPAQQPSAVNILRAQGATDIEKAEGTITHGRWADFSPLTPRTPIAN